MGNNNLAAVGFVFLAISLAMAALPTLNSCHSDGDSAPQKVNHDDRFTDAFKERHKRFKIQQPLRRGGHAVR